MRTCVRAYVRTCVRVYVGTCVGAYVRSVYVRACLRARARVCVCVCVCQWRSQGGRGAMAPQTFGKWVFSAMN